MHQPKSPHVLGSKFASEAEYCGHLGSSFGEIQLHSPLLAMSDMCGLQLQGAAMVGPTSGYGGRAMVVAIIIAFLLGVLVTTCFIGCGGGKPKPTMPCTRPPITHDKIVQSQTTYTALRGAREPRFLPLTGTGDGAVRVRSVCACSMIGTRLVQRSHTFVVLASGRH